jgi:uncharacterized protein (DUF2164 family)
MSKNKNASGKIEIKKEVKAEMLFAIKAYFLQERDEDLGDLAAGFILDFFLEELGPHIYNQCVYDSYRYIDEKMEDLLGILKY